MEKEIRSKIIALVQSEVLPAVGCTEPAAVSLCVAKAHEMLGADVDKVNVLLSPNILKNAMGVGIPGTGMIGLPIAIALGATIGKSEYKLEVLKDVTPEAVEDGKRFIADGRIDVKLKDPCPDVLYVEAHAVAADGAEAVAYIMGGHTTFVTADDVESACEGLSHQTDSAASTADDWLNLQTVYDFATTAPLAEIDFINEARKLNEAASEAALRGNYGHELGKVLSRPLGKGIMGESIFSHIISSTACACDARMAGAMVPVMSNSGSGNQGICATLPVVTFAKENHNTEEELTRALMLSHLTAIYIKQSLGKLSALCGCVVASTGSSVGITYLMGGTYEHVSAAVKNMIANLAGMICDGAKPSCALKLASGVSTAVYSAILAMQSKCVTSVEGIIDDDVDRSIHNLTKIGHDAMSQTDRCVLDIMTHKS